MTCVVWWIDSVVAKDQAASIIKEVSLMIEAAEYTETSINLSQTERL
jgi:hypothetical protein